VAVVGTEKGDIEVECFEEGTVEELCVAAGTEVSVGALLARIRGAGEAAEIPAPAAAPVQAERAPVREAAVPAGAPVAVPAAVPTGANGHRVRVSPLARKLADELGVDLAQVHGAGEHGAISRSDVEEAAAALKAPPAAPPVAKPEAPPPAAPPAVPPMPAAAPADKTSADFQAGMRRAIALAMARANRDIPHYYLQTRIDMTAALAWLEAENLKRAVKDRVLPAVLLIKAVAKSLTRVPELNGFWQDDRLQVSEAIHIGFAIALRQGGLVTPAIHHADLKDMDGLMAALRDLIMRTRAGRLRSSELTDATITLTSLGDLGVETVYGVIYPPQVALVGMGKITEQVWVEHGMIGVRPVLTATLAGDHRATDGRTGGQFMDVLNTYLQTPEKLWEPS
jgi:pyruvate dehydrogenase E2 component (dihydrolipoamide acetyltransferase)